jgi:hypothetical protein
MSARDLTKNVLLDTSEVNGLDTTDLLLDRGGSGSRTSGQTSSDSIGGSDEGALLDAGSSNLAGHWRPQGLGEASGGHDEDAEEGLRDELKPGEKTWSRGRTIGEKWRSGEWEEWKGGKVKRKSLTEGLRDLNQLATVGRAGTVRREGWCRAR